MHRENEGRLSSKLSQMDKHLSLPPWHMKPVNFLSGVGGDKWPTVNKIHNVVIFSPNLMLPQKITQQEMQNQTQLAFCKLIKH